MLHRIILIYSLSLAFFGGILTGVNPYFPYYCIIKLQWTQYWCDISRSILMSIGLFLGLVLPLIIFYSQGRKIDLRIQYKNVILSLYLGALLGGYIGRLIGTTAIFSLIGIGDLFRQLPALALNWIYPHILGTLDSLFISFTAISVGYFRKRGATPST